MKVLILDDHHAILLFVKQKVFEIVPSAEIQMCSSITEAKMAIETVDPPSFVICDLELNSGRSTVIPELCKGLKVPCMVYSSHVDKVLLKELRKCGVQVYVSKLSTLESLLRGIEALFVGEKYHCPFVTATDESKELYKETEKLKLTDGQIRVLEVMLKGCNRVDAAHLLNISLTTLNNHIARAREINDCENFDELLRCFRYWDRWN